MESWRKNPVVFWLLNLGPAFWLFVFFIVPLTIVWVISFGEKRGVAFGGAATWRLKDWIDRRFMERFQVLAASGVPAASFPSPDSMPGADAAMECGGCAAKVGPTPLAAALARLGEPPSDPSVRLGLAEPVDHPLSLAIVGHQSRALQNRQMARDAGLGEMKVLDNGAHALVALTEQAEDPSPRAIGQSLEDPVYPLSLSERDLYLARLGLDEQRLRCPTPVCDCHTLSLSALSTLCSK